VPVEYEIDVARRLVRTRMWDELSDEDLRALDDRLQVDPRFVLSFRAICDLRSVTSITASVETLRFLAQRSLYLPVRRALVVGKDIDFGIARLFEAYCEAEGGTVEVFRSIADAEAWLGLREQSADPDRLQDAKK
jgi:hypothetical protein